MIDNKTAKLQLPLPDVDNYLEEDVVRLQESLTILDGAVATVGEDGKIPDSEIPELIARLTAEGLLPVSIIPDEIAREEDVLTRSGNLEGIADRAAAWLNIRPTGATPLAGDGVGDYDACTMRQARNMGGGAGPTQSGVMNYGVGSRRLHDSRAWIPSYEVFGDGQLLSRAANPDLWAFAQLVGLIDDSVWKSTPAQRGHYSRGDGSTTFRVPDLNGVKKNGDESGAIVGDSIPGLHGRGDGGVSSNNGVVQQNAAPNITGRGGNFKSGGTATFEGCITPDTNTSRSDDAGPSGPNSFKIDASLSSKAYGRDNTDEVRTNSFIGVWVIRASGGFTAANTAWHVINGDAVAPGTGTLVRGGDVFSDYKVANADYVQAIFRSRVTIGGAASAEVVIRDSRSGTPVDKIIDIGALDARVGAAVLTVTNPALNSRTVLQNPFGNNTPVWCMTEIFHATLQKWVSTNWIWTGTAPTANGISSGYAEGEGIIVRAAPSAFASNPAASGATQEFSSNYTTPSPVRVHVFLAKS